MAYEHFGSFDAQPLHEFGPLKALEIPNANSLQIFDEHMTTISWNSLQDYLSFRIPPPEDFRGMEIGELGAGLGGYALRCQDIGQHITVIEPVGYDDLEQLLQRVRNNTKNGTIGELAEMLANRAQAYQTSDHIHVVQARVEDVAEQLKGRFDAIVSLGLKQHLRKQAHSEILKLGKPQAKYYIN